MKQTCSLFAAFFCLSSLLSVGASPVEGTHKANLKDHKLIAPADSAATSHEDHAFSGRAHWYGGSFHGKPTASGEVFDKYKLTAAHPNLPLGTRVKVVSTYSGRSCVVTINDRCPSGYGRVIDLSQGAAQEIGIWPSKPAAVRCIVLSRPFDHR